MSDAALEAVKARAKELGIKHHHRAGVATIQKLIDEHVANSSADIQQPKVPNKPVVPISTEEFRAARLRERRLQASRLIRVRIQCMDPSKKDFPGEILSVGSAKLGTFKKYVPYNNEPYHIPHILYEMMKEKTCSVYTTVVNDRGQKVRKSRQVPAYNIEVLDPLTNEEIKELARKQAMARGATA